MDGLRRNIEKVLASPSVALDEILPNNRGWTDAVTKLSLRMSPSTQRAPSSGSRADYIRRKLGHIIASRDNFEALRETYVTLEEAGGRHERLGDEVVNRSKESIKEFVAYLVKRAKEARDSLLVDEFDRSERARAAARNFHLILFGERGVGKTFLENHILAKFSDYFDQERILWVRIDLVESFAGALETDFKFNLLHRIYAQVSKIVLRYYEPRSDYYKKYGGKEHPLEALDDLFSYAKEQAPDEETAKRWIDDIESMRQSFCTVGQDHPVSPHTAPMHLATRLVEFVRRKEYSIICVLDGLDRLESSAHQVRRFKRIFEAAVRLTSSGLGNLGMMLVSVTRTNTLDTLPDVSREPNHYISGELTMKEVHAVDLQAILERRNVFLIQKVAELAPKLGWALNDWPEHLTRFGNFLQASQDDDVSGVRLEVFGLNRRAQVQVIQLRYYDFLQQEENSYLKPYVFLESLVLCGQRYPSKPYRWSLTEAGNWRKEFVRDTANIDNHLLPSVFDFPYVDWSQEKGPTPPAPHPHGILWGLRLLQIVATNERLRREYTNVDRLTVKETSDILAALFNYPKDQTVDLVDTFAEYEFLYLRGDDFPVYRTPHRLEILLTPKGSQTLRHFLYRIAYLNLCAMRVPLSNESFESGAPFFVAASLDTVTDPITRWDLKVSQSLLQWTTAKIINSVGLYLLISATNNAQQSNYQSGYLSLASRSPRWRILLNELTKGVGGHVGMFEFPKKVALSITSEVSALIESIYHEDSRAIAEVERLLEPYWSVWHNLTRKGVNISND